MSGDIDDDHPEWVHNELPLIEEISHLVLFLYKNSLQRQFLGVRNPVEPSRISYSKAIVHEHVDDITAFLVKNIQREADLGRAEIRALGEEFRQIVLPELQRSHELMIARIEAVLQQEIEKLKQRLAAENERLAAKCKALGIPSTLEEQPALNTNVSRLFYTATRPPLGEGKDSFSVLSKKAENMGKAQHAAADRTAERALTAGRRARNFLAKLCS